MFKQFLRLVGYCLESCFVGLLEKVNYRDVAWSQVYLYDKPVLYRYSLDQ